MNIDVSGLFALNSVMAAAEQTGLLQALLSGPRTANAYAEALGLDRRAAVLVLDALATLNIASREDDAYDASPRVKALVQQWKLWSHATTFLRTGEPLAHMDGTTDERETSYRAGVSWLGKLVESTARELASKLTEAPARVLDVGCGSGVWSLAIAERFPSTHVTGQDLPAVLESFNARAESLNLGNRVATIAGDMHTIELPAAGFDLVVIANVLRLEIPERAAALIARFATAVAPGGALLVVDALANGTHERELARALYALHLALRTRSGRVHSPAEIASWLKTAGLSALESIDLGGDRPPPGAMGALIARK